VPVYDPGKGEDPVAKALRVLALVVALASVAAATRADDLEAAVTAMARVGSASSPTFSPDGTRLAFVSNLSGLPQVWTMPLEGGWPELVTPFDDPVGFVEWSPEGSWLAFTVAPGGGMNQQVYVSRPDGSGLRRLTAGGRETNALAGWTRDGRMLRLGSNLRTASSVDAYLLDPATGSPRARTSSPGMHVYTDVSRDGTRAVVSRLLSRGDNNLYLVDLGSGRETLLTPHDGPGSFGGGRFSPDGRVVYLSSNKDRDTIALARVTLSPEGRPGPVELVSGRDDAELQEFDVDRAGREAVLLWNASGRSELAFVDLASGVSSPGPALPAEIAFGAVFSPDGGRVALAVSGAAAPQDIWILDRAQGTFRQLTRSPHAGVDLARLVRPTLVRFPAHDGLELTAWLYRPNGARGPGPLVMTFHGGPEGQSRPVFRSDIQALLARGIAVLDPNVRGSSGFGKRFVNLDNGALRREGVRDIAACLDYVTGAGIAEPGRIGIMGGSYGGYMTMAGLTEYPDRFAAGANLFGVVNFATFFAHTEPWMAAISKVEYGDPETQSELLRSLSPIHKVDRVKAPTIVLHGANDTNVPVVEAEQVVDSLKKRGVPVEYVLFPDEGHGFRKTPNRIRSTVAIVRWFAEHLQADGRSSRGDAG
jgi:dipeptidyl aminopeptidase/acylaminoacyl peptidase